MTDRRRVLQMFGASVLFSLAGCSADDFSDVLRDSEIQYESTDPDELDAPANPQADEPAEPPDSLTDAGFDLDQVEQTFVEYLNGNYEYVGLYARSSTLGVNNSRGILVAGDDEGRGIRSRGWDSQKIDDPLEAEELEKYYLDESVYWTDNLERYIKQDTGAEELRDLRFDDDLERFLSRLSDIEFSSPEWDDNEGAYVVHGTGTDYRSVDLDRLEIAVSADGLPYRVEASWQDSNNEHELLIHLFEREGSLDPPEWVTDGEENDLSAAVGFTDLEIREEEISVGDTIEVKVHMETEIRFFIALTLEVDGDPVEEWSGRLNRNARTMITLGWEADRVGEFDISVNGRDAGTVRVIE